MTQIPDMRILLDRYWVGETTLEEERRIKAFFAAADDNLPEEFRQEARWFRILQSEQAIEAPLRHRAAYPARSLRWYGIAAALLALLAAIGWWWHSSSPILMDEVVQNRQMEKIPPQKPNEQPVAAVLNNTHGLVQTPVAESKSKKSYRLKKPAAAPMETDSCDDPEQALAEIKAALALISSKINKSKETLDKGLQEVDHIDILLKRKNG